MRIHCTGSEHLLWTTITEKPASAHYKLETPKNVQMNASKRLDQMFVLVMHCLLAKQLIKITHEKEGGEKKLKPSVTGGKLAT